MKKNKLWTIISIASILAALALVALAMLFSFVTSGDETQVGSDAGEPLEITTSYYSPSSGTTAFGEDPCSDIKNGFAIDHFESLHSILLEEPFDTGIQNYPDQGMISLVVEGGNQATLFLLPGQYGQMFGEMSDGRGVFVEVMHCGHSYATNSYVAPDHTMHEILLQKAMSGETLWEDVNRLLSNEYPDSPVVRIAVVEKNTGKIIHGGKIRLEYPDHVHDFDILEEGRFTSWWTPSAEYQKTLESFPTPDGNLRLLTSDLIRIDDNTHFLILIVEKVEP